MGGFMLTQRQSKDKLASSEAKRMKFPKLLCNRRAEEGEVDLTAE